MPIEYTSKNEIISNIQEKIEEINESSFDPENTEYMKEAYECLLIELKKLVKIEKNNKKIKNLYADANEGFSYADAAESLGYEMAEKESALADLSISEEEQEEIEDEMNSLASDIQDHMDDIEIISERLQNSLEELVNGNNELVEKL